MSWLTNAWGQGGPFGTLLGAVQGKSSSVNALKGDLSNSIKDSADIVAPFTGPWAPLVAGVGNATSSLIAPGGNIGQGLKSGAIGAAAGEAGSLIGSALGGAGASGAGTAYGADASPSDLGLATDAVPQVAGNGLPAYGDVASALGTSTPPSLGGDATDALGAASGNVPFTDSAGVTGDPSQIPLAQTGMGAGPKVGGALQAPSQTDPLGTAASSAPPMPVGASPSVTAQNASQGGNQKGLLANVLGMLEKNPNLAGQALSSIGNAPLNEARAKQIALENQLYQQQIDRSKSLDPLRQALANAFQQRMANPAQVASNPYLKAGQTVAPNPYAVTP